MDIQYLINEAKETLLTSGDIMPMLYLELTGKQAVMFALDILSDSQSIPEQCRILKQLGYTECKKYRGQQPIAIGFYSEAWKVVNPESDELRRMPVKSSKRQEIITVQIWSAGDADSRAQAYSLPIIRDWKKRITDVGPAEGPILNVSWQIAAFLEGCFANQ